MRRIWLLVLGVIWGTAACGAFEDPSPKTLTFRMTGETGKQAEVIYSTQFVAGVDEVGTTRVTIFRSDTVVHTLPIDTVFDIEIDRQWFVLVLPTGNDTLSVDVTVDVNNRNLLRESGGIFPDAPWTFVYMFNRPLTRDIDVVF